MMMTVILVLVATLLIVLCGFLVKYKKIRSGLPGPAGLSFNGTLSIIFKSTKDTIPILVKWFNNYGDIYEMSIFGMKYVFVAKPEVIELVLSSSKHITKSRLEYSFIKVVTGDGLIVSNGDKWCSRRKLLTPSFHFKVLEKSLESICRNAEEFVSSLLASGGKPIDIHELIDLLTLKIICETAMGVKLNPDDKQQNKYLSALHTCIDDVVFRYTQLWLYPDFTYRHSTAGKRFFKSLDIVRTFVEQVIKNKKDLSWSEQNSSLNNDTRKKVRRKAFLDTLLELDMYNPGLMTETDIKEEVNTFMAAGHHTISSALTFSHFLLANHPEVQVKAYEEQMEIFGDDIRIPTPQDLNKMTYLEMVIKETLRLYPSVPFHSRALKEDLKIDENTIIPAGYNFVIVTYEAHRSKRHWTKPEEFIPERFAPGTKRHPFSFIPFSAGPRNCIGQKFAMMELKTILSAVVRHCRLEPVTTSITLDYGITLKPAEPIKVKVIPRDQVKRQ